MPLTRIDYFDEPCRYSDLTVYNSHNHEVYYRDTVRGSKASATKNILSIRHQENRFLLTGHFEEQSIVYQTTGIGREQAL